MNHSLATISNPFATIHKEVSSLVSLNPNILEILWHIDATHSSSEHPIIFNALHQKKATDKFQWGFKTSELTPEKLSEIVNLSSKGFNIYMSQASFLKPHQRIKQNAFSSECIIVDIDYYNIPSLKGYTAEQVFDQMQNNGLFDKASPSYAINSGNGLYLIYLLELVPLYRFNRNVKLWELVTKELVNQFKSFGGDPKACDISRVNRLPYSTNQKTGKEAYIINFNTLKVKPPTRYTLSSLADMVLPYTYEDVLTYKKLNKVEKKISTSSSAKPYQLLTPYSLALARCDDLERLLEFRSYDIDGYRNTFLFLYSLFALDKLSSFDHMLAAVNTLNNKLLLPLPPAEINRTVKSTYENYLEKQKDFRRGYKFTNEHIIQLLEFKDDEIGEMKTILSKAEKLNRLKASQKAKRRNENGLTQRQQNVKDKKDIIKSLKKEGLTLQAIAEHLHMSKRQVQRYLQK